jgi:DNA polymerase-3 subunit epsilon
MGMAIFVAVVIAVLVLYAIVGGSKRRVADTAARLSILPDHFIIVDLETTGLDPEKDEIIEIGAIRANRDSMEHQAFQAFVTPIRKIPKRITDLTGITQEMLDKQGEPLEQAIRQFADFAGDLRIVTFNADFDMPFLHRAASHCEVTFSNPVSCALKMARRAWPGRHSYRLVDLANDGGLDTSDCHRSIGDCKRALIVYTGAVARLGTLH